MLRSTCVWWGRWNSRDFLKGRGKHAGAVHVRHTHGSKGRYKRLSDMYGLRDGRRHAQNSMKGGLGIKLGGGLFGLRMPRQHLLSTMTREQFDLELYGHPNITNPYRDLMDEHPDLKAVMESASVMPHLVVLLPRVKRDLSGSAAAAEVPAAWQQVGEELTALLSAAFFTMHVRLCTLDASVAVTFPASEERQDAAPMQAALLALYRQHCRTGRRLVEDKGPQVRRRQRKPHLALFGAEMQRPRTASGACSYTSAALAKLARPTPVLTLAKQTENTEKDAPARQGAVSLKGVSDLVHEFREHYPEALCVCLRPSAILAQHAKESESVSEVVASASEEAKSDAALQQLKAMLQKKKAQQSAPHSAHKPVAQPHEERQLLKTDVDPDTQKGVWATPPTAHLSELLRWQYANRDPRAHSSDGVPHKARRLPCVLLVDLSKRPAARRPEQQRRQEHHVQSLLPDEVSNALVTLRYVPVKSANLEETFAELGQWHVECSWNKMLEVQAQRKEDPVAAPLP